MNILFSDDEGREYGAKDVEVSLRSVGAHDCDVLFIHSDVMFGNPAPGFKRRVYLETLWQIIGGLGVKHVIVPTFTYSFCNHEDYDVQKSRTSMGAFSEYVRKLGGRYRTLDPLLSVSVPYELKDAFLAIGENSLGNGCALDVLHHMDGVKFLFLGASLADCFTYVHYVEKMMDVPYRFDMRFEGTCIGYDREPYSRVQYIHTQCGGVKLPSRYDYFEESLLTKSLLQKERLGNKYVACLSEVDAYREIVSNIKRNPSYYLEEEYSDDQLTHEYTYDYTKSRITHC